MIRPATAADLSAIVEMSRLFYPTTHYADWCDMDVETVTNLAAGLISDHVMHVAEKDGRIVGMIGLFISPFMFNRNSVGAYEVVWWLDPESRGGHLAASLLQSVEEPCRRKGATRVLMLHMANSPPQAGALYERMGYALAESSYSKDL